MIVLPQEKGFLLVRQPDHAAMSSRLAYAWVRPRRIPQGLWQRFLQAVKRHDDGWHLEEELPSLDPKGRPYDFQNIPFVIHLSIWKRCVDLAAADDPYQGLVIGQHVRWLFTQFEEKRAATEPEQGKRFLEEIDQILPKLLERLDKGSGEDRLSIQSLNLQAARRLLSFFDSYSLMLLGAIPPAQRNEPLPFGGNVSALAIEKQGKELTVRPWPFQDGLVPVEVRAFRIEKDSFQTSQELAAEIARAPEQRLRWELRLR